MPKASAIPTRLVLIAKCGNYTRDDISDSLLEHGYPISLPEIEIFTLSSPSCTPIDLKASFKEGAHQKKQQYQDQKMNGGNVSTKTETLLEVRPLVSCNKKNVAAKNWFIRKLQVAQKRIRTHYVEHCKGSVLKDAANVLMLSYITIKSQPGSKQNSLLPPESGGESIFYKVPDKKCCFKGPNNCNDWLISNCHIMNLGYGEDSKGKVVKHNRFWFAWDVFYQRAPHEILCRQPAFMEEET